MIQRLQYTSFSYRIATPDATLALLPRVLDEHSGSVVATPLPCQTILVLSERRA
jgi:hypothetical protein